MAERDKSKNKIPLAPDRMKKRGRPPLMLRGRGRGRPPSSSTVPPNIVSNVETGSSFVPYHLTVNPGEDLLEKVATFAKASSLTVCVLSAVGSISRVVFRKPCPPPIIDTVTWEGRFQILSLSGKYTFVPGQEGKYGEHNSWNLAISDFNGAVFGGSVVGPIIVASPVELILATFQLKSAEEIRRHAYSRLKETDTEMVDGKKCGGSSTSELSSPTPKTDDQASESVTPKKADQTSESDTPKTIDKTSESVTTTSKTTDKPTESGTSTTRDYPMNPCIDDAEKVPGEDPKGEGEKESDCLTTDKPPPDSVTPKTTDKPPQEQLSSETVDKPPENSTPSTSDKHPDDVTPATSDKRPENVSPATSDQRPENVSPATSDKPPENVSPATSDKPPENVSPATTTKSPENVVAATSDT